MSQLEMQPLVSVIVPVYNVEKYLACCLESIINQTYQNLDIILVNGGSTDGSGGICRQYAQRDSRIRLFERENMGPGPAAARNTGLDNMKGEYVVFVDSDDYIAPHMIEVLLGCIQKYHVSIAGSYDLLTPADEEDNAVFDAMPENGECFGRMMSREEVFECMYNMSTDCGKIFDRKIFEKIRFAVGKIYEDEFIFPEIYIQVDEIYCLELRLYAYRQSLNSMTRRNGERYSIEEIRKELFIEHLSFFQKYGTPEDVRRTGKRLFQWYVYPLDWSNKRESKKKVSELEREVHNIMGKKFFWLRFAALKNFPDVYWFMRKIYLKIKF